MKLDKVIAVRTNKTIYRDGDLAIKVFDESFPKSDILNEALNQSRIEETGLNVPALVEVLKIDGRWAIVSEYIPGKTLQQLMDEQPDKKEEYLNLFVDIQLDMHGRKAPLLNKIQDKMHRKVSQSTFDATTRYELHTRLNAMPKHDKVCHGDFNPSNIIISDRGVPYILDWSHATQGNPRRTRRAHSCCSASWARRSWPSAIWNCSAPRATPPSSTSKSGFPSSPRPSRSRASRRSAIS